MVDYNSKGTVVEKNVCQCGFCHQLFYRAVSLTLVREQRFIRINFSMKRGLIPNIRTLCYVIIIR